jgi:geranylgeranyl pyrophosphate synthase
MLVRSRSTATKDIRPACEVNYEGTCQFCKTKKNATVRRTAAPTISPGGKRWRQLLVVELMMLGKKTMGPEAAHDSFIRVLTE